MMKFGDLLGKYLGLLLLVVALVVLIDSQLAHQSFVSKTIDLSWPNCHYLPSVRFERVIVGVNAGLDFHSNPCTDAEPIIGVSYSAYANSGNPGFPRIHAKVIGPLSCATTDSLNCYSFNYGYQAALYSIKKAVIANVHSAIWWIDVETDNSWTDSVRANREDILGMIQAFSDQKLIRPKIGIYTASQQWTILMGQWHLSFPLWLGTGATSEAAASKHCSDKSTTGGEIVMTQYTSGGLDYNYICHGQEDKFNF